MSSADLLAFGMDTGTGTAVFSAYRSALTLSPAHYATYNDLHRLHQLVLNGYGSMTSKPINGRVLFATARDNPTRTRTTGRLVTGMPHRILTQSPTPPNWKPLIEAKILTKADTDHIEQTWTTGARAQIRLIACPLVRDRESGKHLPIGTDAGAGEWLRAKLKTAGLEVAPDEVSVSPSERAEGQEGTIKITSRTFTAYGTVTDPAAFTEALTSGVGKGRAYGYGLLLARPTQ